MSEIRSLFGDTARADGRAVANASDLEVGRGVAQGRGRSPLSLTVNGQIHAMVVEPRMTLDALREEPALTARKKGCDRGERGACTVHAEGRRVLSCMSLAVMQEGKRITTIKDWSGTASSARSRRSSSSTTVSNAGSARPGRSCRASR